MTDLSKGGIELRILRDDWQLWRKLRLQALEEAPYAFSSRLAEWQGTGDSETRWRSRLSAVPLNIVAELNGNPAGMVSATAPSPDGTVELISMWVAPFARGRGVGDSLVTAVVDWAEQQQALRISLAVFEGNQPALSLYARHGFVDIGASTQDCSATGCERQMVRSYNNDLMSTGLVETVSNDLLGKANESVGQESDPPGWQEEERRVRSMKALVVSRPGGEFELQSIAKPELQPGHVLVRVQAACINPLDTKIRAGAAAHAEQSLPAVLGLDMAGVIEAAAEDVQEFNPGDEVFGLVGGVGGHQGTLAEYVCVPAVLLARKPKSLSMRQTAALPLATITAWEGLMDRARVHAGQTVLVHAGAGGVGHIVVQLAKAAGAEVFATASPEKHDVVLRLGAIPVDYRGSSVEQYMQQYTGGAGFDIVYDTVGGAVLDASFIAAKRYTGHVVSCLGWGTHSLAPLSFRGATYSGVFTLLPLLTGIGQEHHGEILGKAAELADSAKLTPMLAKDKFTPQRIDAAFDAVSTGVLGKVVVDLSNWF